VALRGIRPADWGDAPSDVLNAAGNPLFNLVQLNWQEPTPWEKGQSKPTFGKDEPFIYALTYDHGSSPVRDRIEYIGLTASPKTRFGNHKTAREIVAKHGRVQFSYAPIDFVKGRNREARTKATMEEIEHLLIWAAPDYLWNDKKQFTMPGMGTNGGRAWHIINKGYRFRGQLPREIIYPWMILRCGRNRASR